jgi:DMSO/TMAO reductase YedYZ molybdopterin-dependent catalytic subunit
MAISRRDALCLSTSTLAGLSLGVLAPDTLQAQGGQPQEPWPETLVERQRRPGFPAPLPLNPDGSAPEHPESAAGPITDPLMWRTTNRQAPAIEFDYRKMAIKVDTRGLGRLGGTLRFADLEKLPRLSRTFLMQCGAPNPRGIVKWTGVRFSDFADMLGLDPGVHYARFIASDRHYVDEPMTTLSKTTRRPWANGDAVCGVAASDHVPAPWPSCPTRRSERWRRLRRRHRSIS